MSQHNTEKHLEESGLRIPEACTIWQISALQQLRFLFDHRVPLSSELECRDGILATTDRMPHILAGPEAKTLTIKATYNDDIIRFRLPLDSGIAKLKEEVSKRLKVDMGTFDIKYLDDDNELVLITCDADLLECADVSKLSGSKIIRLLVHDVTANPGSSCESLG